MDFSWIKTQDELLCGRSSVANGTLPYLSTFQEGKLMKVVRIVIVNTRTPGLVIDSLRSLAPEIPHEGDCRVIVADNASPDGSTEKIRGEIQKQGWDWAEVQQLDANRGFGAANNAVI